MPAPASGVRDLIHALRVALGAGFALQILVGALSYLTPVMLGGGPKASRATNLVMDRAAAYRVTAANSCLLLALTPALPWEARLTCGATAGCVTLYALVGMVLSGLEVRRRSRDGAASRSRRQP